MRLDVYLMTAGFAESRNKARHMIDEGIIYINDKPASKVSLNVSDDDEITIQGQIMPYVGRGGIKLKAALDAFDINVSGAVTADIGASTGGFTDCLLQHGAKKIFAVDSGRGQLHSSLMSDNRVVSMENNNARFITYETIGEYCDIIVMDVSFISQTLLYGSVRAIMKDEGKFVSLIKPQFEAGLAYTGKKGILRDKSVHIIVIKKVIDTAQLFDLFCEGLICSPILGGDGNREYFALFSKANNNINIDDIYLKNLVYG